MIVRENTEGLSTPPGRAAAGRDEVAADTRSSRVPAQSACTSAPSSSAERRAGAAPVTVDKANVCRRWASSAQVFDEVAREYPGVETESVYVDATALYLVKRPERST